MHSLGLSTNGSESEAAPVGAAVGAPGMVANSGGGGSESNGVSNNFSNGDALSSGSSSQTTPTTATGAAGGSSSSSNGVANNSSYTNGSARGGGAGGNEGEADDDDEDEEEEEEVFDGDGRRRPYLRNGKQPLRPPKKAPAPYVIKSQTDRDIIRLIGQQLHIMGLGNTASQLIKESGCRLDHPTAAKFRSLVMGGEWGRADVTLLELKPFLNSSKHLVMMKYLLLEQKYLESIEDERHADALKCLQSEIKPLNYKKESLPQICRYLFLNSIEELKQVANWEGKGPASRQKLMEKLQNFLPPAIMLPPRRLQTLLNQAIERQKDQCFFHNHNLECSWEDFSLLVDHSCSKDDLPSETTQILEEHRDEVWYCQFSNDGTRLATGAKDGTIIIWEVDPDTLQLSVKYTFAGHSFAIAFFAWSPDDHWLVALGAEEAGEFCIWDCTTGLIKHKGNNQTDDSLTTCAWHPDSQRFAAAGTRGHFYQIDLEGNIVDNWEGVRVQCLAYKKDGKVVLAADTHCRIRGYNFEEVNDFTLIKEDHSIVSFVCDRTGRYALVNVESQGVHLWDLEDRVLVRKFQGLSQGLYTIHSCFGGVDQVFLASGSEDNKIYIWHKKREHPISVLKGHRRTVNCVSWNPRYTNMLASASDDTTVRIWTSKRRAPEREPARQPAAQQQSSTGSGAGGGAGGGGAGGGGGGSAAPHSSSSLAPNSSGGGGGGNIGGSSSSSSAGGSSSAGSGGQIHPPPPPPPLPPHALLGSMVVGAAGTSSSSSSSSSSTSSSSSSSSTTSSSTSSSSAASPSAAAAAAIAAAGGPGGGPSSSSSSSLSSSVAAAAAANLPPPP